MEGTLHLSIYLEVRNVDIQLMWRYCCVWKIEEWDIHWNINIGTKNVSVAVRWWQRKLDLKINVWSWSINRVAEVVLSANSSFILHPGAPGSLFCSLDRTTVKRKVDHGTSEWTGGIEAWKISHQASSVPHDPQMKTELLDGLKVSLGLIVAEVANCPLKGCVHISQHPLLLGMIL